MPPGHDCIIAHINSEKLKLTLEGKNKLKWKVEQISFEIKAESVEQNEYSLVGTTFR